jgi:hypothetical protein
VWHSLKPKSRTIQSLHKRFCKRPFELTFGRLLQKLDAVRAVRFARFHFSDQ